MGERQRDLARSSVATRVLIALDESAASIRAARVALTVFDADRTEFYAINLARVAVPWLPASDYGAVAALPSSWDEAIQGMDEQELEHIAEWVEVPDPRRLTDAGDPAYRISEAADEHEIDIVVVGHHDTGILERSPPSVRGTRSSRISRPLLVISHDAPGRDSRA